jgi:hypothetical protein
MPLFLAMLVGLILSARLDWHNAPARRNWVIALWLYLALSADHDLFPHAAQRASCGGGRVAPRGRAGFYKTIALVGSGDR